MQEKTNHQENSEDQYYVVKNIKKDQYIDNFNIKKIRPSNGVHPKYYYKILGKKAKKILMQAHLRN